MSDQIKITVEVNGRPGTLADVSQETLLGMRDKARVVELKPIEHGGYGYSSRNRLFPRLFIKINGAIAAYDDRGALCCKDVNFDNMKCSDPYIADGNIFKDLQNG